MVYDATKCGLTAALWTPKFFLLTIDKKVIDRFINELWMQRLAMINDNI